MTIRSLFKCPPKQHSVPDTCPADLAACVSQLALANDAKLLLAGQLDDAERALATAVGNLQTCNTDLGKAQQAYALLTGGPPAPDKSTLRLLPVDILHQLMQNTLGQRWTECAVAGGIHFAWPPWLICKKSDLQRYLDFYNQNILPTLLPYTTWQWTDTHGQTQEISIRSCSEMAGHFYGMRAQWLGWSGLCWGIFWANVNGTFLSGGHAFNWTVVWNDGYDELSTGNLEALQIEPQTSGDWDIRGKAINDSARIESLEPKPLKDTPMNYVIVDNGLYLVLA